MDIVANFGTFINANVKAFSELHVVNKGLLVFLILYVLAKVAIGFIQGIFAYPQHADDPSADKYDRNKVYVHVFPRSTMKNTPNGSPFVMKLETWLRMANIEYEVVETMAMSRTTKQIPYIFHKGKEITDSNLIIDYLSKEFDIDASEGLSEEQQAVSRAFSKMVDDSTFWNFITHSSVYNPGKMKDSIILPVPKMFRKLILNTFVRNVAHRAKVTGTGRKPANEIVSIGKDDLRAISTFLADKKFLMGDQMTKVDCAVFGQLFTGVYYGAPSSFSKFLEAECKNVAPYMARIKEKCWPDWKKYSDITFTD